MSPELSRFFDAMAPLLRGDVDAREACAALNAEPSSFERLDMITRMVRRARENLLENAYAATRMALGEEAFAALVERHLAAEGGTEPDFPRIALGLPETLAAGADGDPGFAHEVADWEEVMHRLRVVGAPAPRGAARTPVIVRRYTFDAPRWVGRARAGKRPAPPSGSPVLILAWRDPDTGSMHHMQPGADHLAALAVAVGDTTEEAVVSAGVEASALHAARAELSAQGVLEDG